MKFTIGRTFAAAALACGVSLFAARTAHPANRLGPDTIALFPKEVGEFGYADLKKARTLKWFNQLHAQVLPERFKDFEKFLASAGVDPNSQIDELAWGLVAAAMDSKDTAAVPTGEDIIGIALGNFNPDSTEAYFKQKKLPTSKKSGYTLFTYGSGSGDSDLYFTFFDTNKAGFGSKSTLEKMIDLRMGADQGLLYNDKLFPLINEANGSSTVWLVLNAPYTRLAVRQLAPEMEQFPEAAKLVARLKSGIVNVDTSSGLDAKVQAVCGSVDDANTMAQLLQAGLLYKRYQASKENPDMGQLLDQARVTPSGDRMTVRLSVTDEQMSSLLQHNTFAFKM